MICVLYYKLYTVRNVLAKNLFFKLFGQIFEASPRYMFLDHVDNFGIFFFSQTNIFNLVRGPEHCFCCFLKNTVPCEFPLLKLYNFCIFYLIGFQVMTRTIFIKSYPVPNYEGGRPTILKRQISQKIFTSEFMLPDSKKFFDALNSCVNTL